MAGTQPVGQVAIYVRPQATKALVGGEYDDRLIVRVGAKPQAGAANEAVCAAIAAAFKVKVREVEITAGWRSRHKRVAIGLPPAEVSAREAELRRLEIK